MGLSEVKMDERDEEIVVSDGRVHNAWLKGVG